jgi:hypothetical protein
MEFPSTVPPPQVLFLSGLFAVLLLDFLDRHDSIEACFPRFPHCRNFALAELAVNLGISQSLADHGHAPSSEYLAVMMLGCVWTYYRGADAEVEREISKEQKR